MSEINQTGKGSDQHDLETHLVNLGLSKYEAKAYAALVTLREATASEIAARSGVPKGRIYDALNELCSKGLVQLYSIEGHTNLYKSLTPENAIDILFRQLEESLEESRTESLRILGNLRTDIPKGEEKSLPVHLVKGEVGIELAFVSLIQNSSLYIRVMLSQNRLKRLLPALEVAILRGVHVVALYETGEELTLLETLRIPARHLDPSSRVISPLLGTTDGNNKPEIIIVDDRRACLILPMQDVDYALITDHLKIIAPFSSIFDLISAGKDLTKVAKHIAAGGLAAVADVATKLTAGSIPSPETHTKAVKSRK